MTETKTLTASIKDIGDDSGPGSFVAVVSSDALDRDGEIVTAHAFDPLPARVPVHDRHHGNVIGSGVPSYVGNELWLQGSFASAPLAQTVRSLVQEGHLSSMSVAFMVSKGGDKRVDGTRHITKGELLAADFAAMPSNRDSRLVSVRAVKDDDDEEKLRTKHLYLQLRGQFAQLDIDVAKLEEKEAARDAERSKAAWKMAFKYLAEERAEAAASEALAKSIEFYKRNPSRWSGPGFDRLADGTRVDTTQTYLPDVSPNVDPECTAPNLGEWSSRNKWATEDVDPGWESTEARRLRFFAPKAPDE